METPLVQNKGWTGLILMDLETIWQAVLYDLPVIRKFCEAQLSMAPEEEC